MNKEELKNIVSEILGNSDDSVFNQFIEKIASSIDGNQALQLNGIGHFQIKKEPLSRMERKIEGNFGEKEILLFLPEDESNEENIISFEINKQTETSSEFNDSVFDVGINKPTIISDPDSEVTDEESETIDESLFNRINEFVESGEIKEGYELLSEIQSDSPAIVDEVSIEKEDVIDGFLSESSTTDFMEAEISEEFMNDDDEDINVENDDDTYNIASSSVEAEITDEDVSTSEAEILKTYDNESNEEAIELEIEDLPKEVEVKVNPEFVAEAISEIEDETPSEIEDEIPSEIEAEIGREFQTDIEEESTEDERETNPFDELDEYIKDDNKDEAQDIIDAEPDTVDEISEELESDSPATTIDKSVDKENIWYKNPILYIATLGFIAAIVVVYIFLPTSPPSIIEDESNSNVINNSVESEDQLGLVDSVLSSDSTNKNSNPEETTDQKLAEIKSVEEKIPLEKKSEDAIKGTQPKTATPTGLYREIKNDQTVTNRIYFDGERYTVQSSSWKSTTIAEREVNKLKKRGFDAFILKVFIASKNGTWNRVRIGYFNTRKEAEEFLKKNKI